jgi:hypothetical protein
MLVTTVPIVTVISFFVLVFATVSVEQEYDLGTASDFKVSFSEIGFLKDSVLKCLEHIFLFLWTSNQS